ncbi:YggT family protein [Sphingomonas oligophenolica]|uniref:YggT family protein n=1 Tax=Sphingomonas oligophenolica TaxID=301154 RepID=A0A502CR00_9SPHN|nr:YggT family protein [Sphingomonas oligophenolica]TPG15657.1 YggT family protein [Sphingomonas oligophenolica]
MFALTIIQILQVLLDLAWWIIFIQFVLSLLITFNVVNMTNSFVRSIWYGLEKMTDPIYRPIRRVLPNTGGIDFSPMVALIVITILDIILRNIAISIVTGPVVV